LFAKGCDSKFKASELNLCKKPMGRRPSCRSFCENLIVKIPRLVWQVPILYTLPSDAKRIFKKAQEKNFFKNRICFTFSITLVAGFL